MSRPGPKSAHATAVSARPCTEAMLTAWAQSFLFAGSSALLLSVANRFPDYWYFSFFALTPFLYRTIKATPVESLRLGLLFGVSFFGASATGSAGISPFITIIRLLAGTALFAFFGWTVGWARQRWGFNPSLVAVFWVGLEMGVANLGLGGGLFGETAFSQPFLHGLVGLLGLLAASAVIVLLNSLLVLALTEAVKTARIRVRTANQSARTWDLLFPFNFSTQRAYLVPEGRAPPLNSEIICHARVQPQWG